MKNLIQAAKAMTLSVASVVHADTNIVVPNHSFESGPNVQVQALPVGTVLDGGWRVIQGSVNGWGCERRSVIFYNCMSGPIARSGAFGVLLGSVNQGGMTESGLELELRGMPNHVYEWRVWVRSTGGANAITLACGGPISTFYNTNDWSLRAIRGNTVDGNISIQMRAVTLQNGNNSCWAPIVDDVELIDLGTDCNRNLIPDSEETDCDLNGVADECDIAANRELDRDSDGVLDVCQPVTCVDADIFRDFNVNGADLGILLSQWGPNTPLTRSDLNRDGVVDGADLGIFLSFWGPCP